MVIFQTYDKYLAAVIENVEDRFHDNHLLKAFNMFNPADSDMDMSFEIKVYFPPEEQVEPAINQ